MAKRIFGELELSILNLFQKDKAVRTVHDVLQALGGEDKYTTIMTVMNRLVAKGELHREREGQSYRYRLQAKKEPYGLFEKWRKKMFGGKSALMISYLLEAGEDITAEELLHLQELIAQAKQKGK